MINVLGCTKILRGCQISVCKSRKELTIGCQAYQFLLQNNIPDFAFPARERLRKISVKLSCADGIRCALSDLQFNEEFSSCFSAFLEHELSVELCKE